MKKLGIIAGEDNLPKVVIEYCKSQNIVPYLVKISSASDQDYQHHENIIFANIGQPGKAIDFFKNNDVKHIMFVGKVPRPANVLKLKVDIKGAALLKQIALNKIFGDNHLLIEIKNFFISHGFEVLALNHFMKELFLQPGIISTKKPIKSALKNIEIGIDLIKGISKFDIGQAVIVEDGRILAVEAAEGTDEMIDRSKVLISSEEACLIKIPKHKQISEIDLPCVGLLTIIKAREAKISTIAIKSHTTILLDRKEVLEFINKQKMCLVVI